MGLFDFLKKKTVREEKPEAQPGKPEKQPEKTEAQPEKRAAEEYLDDVTFIQAMKHTPMGPWHQYDVLLAARGYGWDAMISWADYMAGADLEHISQVTTGAMGASEQNITESYHHSGGKCSDTPELQTERGILCVAGISRVLRMPMKIVWFNQTRALRFFTPEADEMLIKKYVETAVRRTFGSEDAMKLGRPIPEGQ